MTVEAVSPFVSNPVTGIGPYGVPFAYLEGSLVVHVVTVAGERILLTDLEYSVTPEEGGSDGDVYLTPATAATYAGANLQIERDTVQEQGWQGLAARERGLERQLDRDTQSLQEVKWGLRGALRVMEPVPPLVPSEGRAIIWQGGKFVPGPTADEIGNAQGYAEAAEDAANRVDLGALDAAVITAINAKADAESARDEAEDARDLAATYSGVQHRRNSWAELALVNGLDGQYGYVPDEDVGTHLDPVVGGTVPNAGVYEWAANGLGSAQATRVGPTGLEQKISRGEGQLALNVGADYPLRPMARDLIVSPANAAFNNAILDVTVRGADPAYFYRIAYFANGNTTLGPEAAPGDWIIEQVQRAGYETAAIRSIVVSYPDTAYGEQDQVDFAGGIQTITLISRVVAGLEFDITLDASLLPTFGTAINAYEPNTRDGWSWIIDPSCYIAKPADRPAPLSCQLYPDGAGGLSSRISWASGNKILRTEFGRLGHNLLPNIGALWSAPLNGDRTPTFDILESSGTDRLPPLTVRAVNDGDAGPPLETGGNHGSIGSGEGAVTARCKSYHVFADGNLMTASKTGPANELRFVTVNELMAYNTIVSGRYVLRQTFTVIFRAGGCEVICEVVPYETVELVKDNGPQMYAGGFDDATHHFIGGQGGRVALNTFGNSGSRALYPMAWAYSLKNADIHKGHWMDRDYGIGDARYVGPTSALMRGGGANLKMYHAAISAAGPILEAGQRYAWRGGYWWTSPDEEAAGIDCTFPVYRNGVAQSVVVYDDGTWTISPDYSDAKVQLSETDIAEITAQVLAGGIISTDEGNAIIFGLDGKIFAPAGTATLTEEEW